MLSHTVHSACPAPPQPMHNLHVTHTQGCLPCAPLTCCAACVTSPPLHPHLPPRECTLLVHHICAHTRLACRAALSSGPAALHLPHAVHAPCVPALQLPHHPEMWGGLNSCVKHPECVWCFALVSPPAPLFPALPPLFQFPAL